MSISSAYNQWASTYDHDRNLTRDLDHVTAQSQLADLRVGSVLEAGCGTGKNSPFYASIAQQVTALDFSEGMLGVARTRPGCENVTFVRHDLLTPWPTPAHSADLVAFNLVLEHIEDLTPVFAQAARTCKPAAIVYVSELHPFRQYRGGQARFQAGDSEVRVTAFRHHISDFVRAAEAVGLTFAKIGEWWHVEDTPDDPPRLLTLQFIKP